MPHISVIVLTKNRSKMFQAALLSVARQAYEDYEIIVVNDGSSDNTAHVLQQMVGHEFYGREIYAIHHTQSVGITKSRQEALEKASGELVAFLDDDDEWVDADKLSKQVQWFKRNPQGVICGGGIKKSSHSRFQISDLAAMRPETDARIRNRMLLQNPFFTSTVMFKKSAAMQAGGFVSDGVDLAEDYDLWLRMGALGTMYNFQEVFTAYRLPGYNRDKFKQFLKKQLYLIKKCRNKYSWYWLANALLRFRIAILNLKS